MEKRYLKRREQHKLAYFAFIVIEDVMWVSNIRYNGIYSIDLLSGKTQFRGRIPGYEDSAMGLHTYVERYENKLVFFPQKGKSIDIYDLDTGEISSYPIDEWAAGGDKYSVAGALLKGDCFWIFPRYRKQPLVSFSMSDHMFRASGESLKKSNELAADADGNLTVSFAGIGDSGWFPIYGTNRVAEINISKGTETIYTVKDAEALQTIAYDGCDFWLGGGPDIIVWNTGNERVKKYRDVVDIVDNKFTMSASFVCWQEYIFVLPLWLGRIKRINKKTGEILIYDNLPDRCYVIRDVIQYWRDLRDGYIRDGKLIINPISRNCEINIDIETGVISEKEYSADLETIPAKKWGASTLCVEEDCSLENFLLLAEKDSDDDKNGMKEMKITAGKNIYETIKKAVF